MFTGGRFTTPSGPGPRLNDSLSRGDNLGRTGALSLSTEEGLPHLWGDNIDRHANDSEPVEDRADINRQTPSTFKLYYWVVTRLHN